MLGKANVEIFLKHRKGGVTVELWDIDPLVDDLIDSKTVDTSGHVEFLFMFSKTGEVRPELQLRIKDPDGSELYRSTMNDSIAEEKSPVTGFIENRTMDLGQIEI